MKNKENELKKEDEVKETEVEEPKNPEENNDEVKETEKMIKSLLDNKGDEIKENTKNEILEEVKTLIKDEREKAKKRAGIYNPKVQKEENRKALNRRFKKFASAICKGDTATLKEMNTGDSSYGGYAVDSELSAEIRHLVTEYGVARREMTTMQLSKNSYKANELVADVSTYWVSEGAIINSSQVQIGQNELSLKKLATIVTMTNELLEDEEIDLFGLIADRVSEGFAQKEDEAFFKGDGTSTYGSFTGLLESSNVNEVSMDSGDGSFADITADYLINMVDSTPKGALSNSKFYLHRSIMSYIRKLKDDNGQYIFQSPSQGGPATIWGYPVVEVEAMPASSDDATDTSFVLFGDLKKGCIFGYKGSIRAKRFDAGVVRNTDDDGTINLITEDREAMRWVERVGYVQAITSLNKPITKLTTASATV